MGDGEAYHGAVGQVDGALHQSLAKGASAYHLASVVVLYGTCNNLGCRGRILIDEHHHTPLSQTAVAVGHKVTTRHATAFGIDEEVAFRQELSCYVGCCLQIAAAVLLQVKHEILHALLLQLTQGCHELIVSSGTEVADAYVADGGLQHIDGIDRLDGYLVALHVERQGVLDAQAHHLEAGYGALGAAQTAHDVLAAHLHTGNGGIVDTHDAVARQYAYFLRRAFGDGLDDHQRVFHHIELHADALKRTL